MALHAPATHDATDADAGANRVIFDLTTTALWNGPPAGIVRVESAFGRWALRHVDRLVPAFYDPRSGAFRCLSHDVARLLISRDATIDTFSFVRPGRSGKRKTDRIPPAIRDVLLWLLQSRRMTLRALERVRVQTANAIVARWADRLQRILMNAKHRAVMVKSDGTRRACLPIDLALGPPISLGPHDTLICSGAGWTHNDIGGIAAAKRKGGFRFVLFCHDVIPLLFPRYFIPADVEAHRQYWDCALPATDLVILSSRTVAADVRAYCDSRGLALACTGVCPLGADAPGAEAASLPSSLERGRFALLVSTIEPRKGHRTIYEAWLKLLEDGIPQRAQFKLVFAGRIGWMVDDLMRDLRADSRTAGTLEVFTDADDGRIAALYGGAAFCLYPSRYEGYGLPAIEAFRYGKAVLASTGGALPEIIGDLSPCLDPDDGGAWRRMLQMWIEDPAARVPYEERIRTSFRHPDWEESARTFFALASGSRGDFDA